MSGARSLGDRPGGRLDHRAVASVAAAVALTGLAALALVPARDTLAPGTVALILLLPPLVASYAGLRATLVCAVIGAVTFNVLFTKPYNSPRIESDEAVAAFVVYLAVAAALGVTVSALRRRSRDAERRARTLEMLERLGEGLLRGPRLEPAVRSGLHELVRLVPLTGAALHVAGDEELRVSAGDPSRAEAAMTRAGTAGDGPRVRSLRHDGRVRVFPVIGGDGSVGLLAADPGAADLPDEGWAVVEGFADLAGLGVARARLETERTRREALEAIERQRTALTRSVSHDLRTPLAAIRAAAGAIRTTDDPVIRWGLLDDIDRQSRHLTELVSDMLDLSRIESGALRVDRAPTPVDVLVDEAVDAVPDAWERVELDIPEDLAPVMLDDTLMRQVLVNLVQNAAVHAPGSRIGVSARRTGDRLELRVADHGPGIPEAERARVFEPYRRLRVAGAPGTGLGLAIARGLVEAHGGTVRVQTTPGGGATMVVEVPAA